MTCPECGSPDTRVLQPLDPSRQFGPGEWAEFVCADCGEHFDALVPEPVEA